MHNDRKGPNMVYVGMDVSSKSFVVHAIDERKRLVWRGEVAATPSGLKRALREIGEGAKLVVVEAGNQMKWIARELGWRKDVTRHIVHPNEVKWISQSSGKTDKVDARKLAELARGDLLPRKVHVVEGHIRELRELVGARHTLQSKRVALLNTVRAYLKQDGHRLPEKFFQRRDWHQALTKVGVSAVTQQIIETFKTSIDALQQSETALTKRLVAIEDERITRLESIPSIGALSARVVLGALDDARRFDNKKCAAKYGALTPSIYQSGELVHLGRINRDGRHEVRRVLLQCAHTLARMKSAGARPLRAFYERVARRRGKKIAIVALARKLLTTAYGVLKAGKVYDPAKLLPQRT
jgi:transposase